MLEVQKVQLPNLLVHLNKIVSSHVSMSISQAYTDATEAEAYFLCT